MNKSDYKNPYEHIFYCDKSDWYEEENGVKKWDKKKCKEFWKKVRKEKMDKKDYDFSQFVFPEFLFNDESFWEQEQESKFEKNVDFKEAQFSGNAYFREVSFLENVGFWKTEFLGDTYFRKARFSGNVDFKKVRFSGYAYFRIAHFLENVDFKETLFSGNVDFKKTLFSGKTDFKETLFSGYAYFKDAKFSKYADFRKVQFRADTHFSQAKFLSEVHFSGGQFLGETNFSKGIFSGMFDFSKTQFLGITDFGGTRFSEIADFGGTQFLEKTYFTESIFLRDVHFSEAKFSGKTDFNHTQFSGFTHFIETKFLKEMSFSTIKFFAGVSFSRAQFSEDVDFVETQFMEKAYFIATQFLKETDFSKAQFSGKVDFSETQFKKRLVLKLAHFTDELLFNHAQISFAKSLDTEGYSLANAILEECNLYGIQKLKNVSFKHSFLVSFNLSNRTLINCNLTGAVASGLATKGWKPDKATIQNTKYIYTDYEVIDKIDSKTGEHYKTYQAKEDSRVPATGEFGVGENEGFTIVDYLRDPIKWSYALALPKEIREGFLSYIQFFTYYLHITKNEEIEIRTKREGKKVRVEFLTDDLDKKAFIQAQFGEYIQKLKDNPDEIHIDFSQSEASDFDQKLFKIKYENRIRDLQTELKYTRELLLSEQEKKQYLLDNIEDLRQNPNKLLTSSTSPKIPSYQSLQKLLGTNFLAVCNQLDQLQLASDYQQDLNSIRGRYQRFKQRQRRGELKEEYIQLQANTLHNNLQDLLLELEAEGVLT